MSDKRGFLLYFGEKSSSFNPYQKLNNYQTLEAIYMLNWKINSACKLQLSCCVRGNNDYADSAKIKIKNRTRF